VRVCQREKTGETCGKPSAYMNPDASRAFHAIFFGIEDRKKTGKKPRACSNEESAFLPRTILERKVAWLSFSAAVRICSC
jgi:hypothetical protein